MKNMIFAVLTCLSMTSAPASAQAVRSTVSASNGTQVTVYSDDFANRYEYTAPVINIPDGFVLVATVRKGGTAQAVHLSGSFSYIGEWRRYNSALFRGGDQARFIEAGRDVGRCFSSRYSRASCSLNESFKIELSNDEIQKHSRDGKLAIQVRAQDTTTALIEVPVAYIEAVKEVSGR